MRIFTNRRHKELLYVYLFRYIRPATCPHYLLCLFFLHYINLIQAIDYRPEPVRTNLHRPDTQPLSISTEIFRFPASCYHSNIFSLILSIRKSWSFLLNPSFFSQSDSRITCQDLPTSRISYNFIFNLMKSLT